MKQLLPETPDIFPVALLCVCSVVFVKALGTDKRGEFKSALNRVSTNVPFSQA